MVEQYDNESIRCPKLGGEVDFRYCRLENNRLPCRWMIGCWEARLDIHRFLGDHYSKEELERIFAPPKPKIQTLVELIEKAKEAKDRSSD